VRPAGPGSICWDSQHLGSVHLHAAPQPSAPQPAPPFRAHFIVAAWPRRASPNRPADPNHRLESQREEPLTSVRLTATSRPRHPRAGDSRMAACGAQIPLPPIGGREACVTRSSLTARPLLVTMLTLRCHPPPLAAQGVSCIATASRQTLSRDNRATAAGPPLRPTRSAATDQLSAGATSSYETSC